MSQEEGLIIGNVLIIIKVVAVVSEAIGVRQPRRQRQKPGSGSGAQPDATPLRPGGNDGIHLGHPPTDGGGVGPLDAGDEDDEDDEDEEDEDDDVTPARLSDWLPARHGVCLIRLLRLLRDADGGFVDG